MNSSAARKPDFGLGVTGSLGASLAGRDEEEPDVDGVGDGGGGGGELMPADTTRPARNRVASRNPSVRTSPARIPDSECVLEHDESRVPRARVYADPRILLSLYGLHQSYRVEVFDSL